MGAHRVWAGVVMIVAAALMQTIVGGAWSLALLVGIGVLLVLTSFEQRRAPR